MFDFLADVLEFFYDLWPSYGVMIILLTLSVRLIFTPLTVRGTKSMLEMRRIQPQMKALQKKYKDDRAQLNVELQALYREHKINPLGGCLPLLAQAPVFLVLYQVLRGLTRRASDLGKSLGSVTSQCFGGAAENVVGPVTSGTECVEANPVNADPDFFESPFNPRYLDDGSELDVALESTTEMLWLGMDLSFSPSSALSESLLVALPFLLMVALVGVLGFVQQRQIAGRNPDAEVNPMQKTLMRVLPIFLPVISFTLPAGLIVYFITTSAIGIGQQAFITRRVYKPWNEEEKVRSAQQTELEVSQDDGQDQELEGDASRSEAKKAAEAPKGLLGQMFGPPQPEDARVHGRIRPNSAKPNRPKPTPPKAAGTKPAGVQPAGVQPAGAKPSKTQPKKAQANKTQSTSQPQKSAKAKKPGAAKADITKSSTRETSNTNKSASGKSIPKSTSRRVTPSKKELEAQRQSNKRRRR